MPSAYSNLIFNVRFRRMDISAMTRDAASLIGRFLRTVGAVTFLALCLQSGTVSLAADFDADRHSEYCGCGNKCRREKCCCGPSEDVPGTVDTETRQSPRSSNPVMTFRNFLCRMIAPCGTDADAPASRVLRCFVPVTAVSVESALSIEDSSRFVPERSRLSIPVIYVDGVDRPPEFRF